MRLILGDSWYNGFVLFCFINFEVLWLWLLCFEEKRILEKDFIVNELRGKLDFRLVEYDGKFCVVMLDDK